MTSEYLKQCVVYMADDGNFIWRRRPTSHFKDERTAQSWNTRNAGNNAGSVYAGRVLLSIDNKKFYAHRLAWLYHYGEWPKLQIDHVNRNAMDNRIANLRLATYSENGRNRKAPLRSLPRGVYVHNHKFVARIKLKGISYHLGVFDTACAASAAYIKAAQQKFGEFYCAE